MDDVVIIWIGHENPALTNIMLSFNACTVGILFGIFIQACYLLWMCGGLHRQFSVCRRVQT
jgi:hypothetical protein